MSIYTPEIKQEGCKLSLSIVCNGYRWDFSLERPTDADAKNLHTLLTQKRSREMDLESAEQIRRHQQSRERDRLVRSNRSLRAYIARLKKGAAK